MIEPWLKLTLLISVAGVIGYIAQRSGLCLIRGVIECRAGRPTLLLAMLSCGICVWLFVPVAALVAIDIPHTRYDWHIVFALGGLIFGLGTSANGGCSVSTMSRLARGDWHMVGTVLGWGVGWCLWLTWSSPFGRVVELEAVSVPIIIAEVIVWLGITFWAIKHSAASRRLWAAIMAVGLLAGVMFVLQPHWAPSALVQDITGTALYEDPVVWPGMERYLVLFALLAGMWTAAWITRRFVWQRIYLQRIVLHVLAGTAMGLGASMAMGGNDTQLLLALPAASPAAMLAVVGMLMGIYIGVVIRQPLVRLGRYLGLH